MDERLTDVWLLKPGDEFLVSGTVIERQDARRVVVILDGETVGTKAMLERGTLVLSTGKVSPNYQHSNRKDSNGEHAEDR